MSLFSRPDLRNLIKEQKTFSRDDDHATALDQQLQPSSFDVTVGKIYVPPEQGDDVNGSVVERPDFYPLKPGAMALVLSREHIDVNLNSGGFVFPKNGDFALKGLLFTNFGHIDPGFKGHLRFTVINMGRHEFTIRAGERIAGVTLFELTTKTDHSYRQHPSNCETHARVLSRDFLDLGTRIDKSAKRAAKEEYNTVDKTNVRLAVGQMVLVMAVALIGFFVSMLPMYEKIANATAEIGKLQFQIDALKRADQSTEPKK